MLGYAGGLRQGWMSRRPGRRDDRTVGMQKYTAYIY